MHPWIQRPPGLGVFLPDKSTPMDVKYISTTSLIAPPGPQGAHSQSPDVLQAAHI